MLMSKILLTSQGNTYSGFLMFLGVIEKENQPTSAQCCISYRNQSFDLQCKVNQLAGLSMKCNTGLKWLT